MTRSSCAPRAVPLPDRMVVARQGDLTGALARDYAVSFRGAQPSNAQQSVVTNAARGGQGSEAATAMRG
jgi:hypothetical protein